MATTVQKLQIEKNAPITITRWKMEVFWSEILVGQVKWIKHGKVIAAIGDTVQVEFPRRWFFPLKTRKWYSFSDKHYRINVKGIEN